uniref:Fimbrial protein n=1 Tax=Heterorhabditis bacteriophora TaxID=37862 RepID=A0A1I7WYP0_HETBA
MSRLAFPLCFLFTATSLIWADESNWETLQVVPYVSGLRVESLPGDKGFIGYTCKQITIIDHYIVWLKFERTF